MLGVGDVGGREWKAINALLSAPLASVRSHLLPAAAEKVTGGWVGVGGKRGLRYVVQFLFRLCASHEIFGAAPVVHADPYPFPYVLCIWLVFRLVRWLWGGAHMAAAGPVAGGGSKRPGQLAPGHPEDAAMHALCARGQGPRGPGGQRGTLEAAACLHEGCPAYSQVGRGSLSLVGGFSVGPRFLGGV